MEALYKRTLRIILGLPTATSGEKLLQLLNISTMKERMEEMKNNHEKRDKKMIIFIEQFRIN
jgi:hypothetical protein